MFAYKIDDAPAAISLLNVHERKSCYLRSSEATADKYSEDGSIAQPFQGSNVRRADKSLGLTE